MNASVDISKIKPGDELTIQCRAYQFRGDGWSVRTLHEDHGTFVRPEHIVSHTPKALSVGDVVWGLATKRNGKVIATHEDLAWVEFEDGKHEVVFPHQVERA